MDVFDLDSALVRDYERFARSFTTIRAQDIRDQVDQVYASGRFWPEPIVSINPHFQVGDSISQLVAEGTLHEKTEQVFRIDGQPLTLFRHQSQAIAKAKEKTELRRHDRDGVGEVVMLLHPNHRFGYSWTGRGRKQPNPGDRCLPDECAGKQPDERTGEVH
jgi:hypothetical protein